MRDARTARYPPRDVKRTVYNKQSAMPVSAASLLAWHERAGAFERLAPPWELLAIRRRQGTIHDGDRLHFAVRKGPLWLPWEALHQGYEKPDPTNPLAAGQFQDVQLRGPFAHWIHTHRFLPVPASIPQSPVIVQEAGQSSVLADRVEYTLPGGTIGNLLGGGLARSVIERMFIFRHERTRRDLVRHRAANDQLLAQGHSPAMRIAMSGSSGSIGSQLLHFLTTGGHRVDRMVRRKADASKGEIFWQPGAGSRGGQIDDQALEGCDAVIHLAGEGVASGRWTAAKMAAIRDSRVEGTRLIARTVAALKQRPRVLVVASGVHYYGDRGDQELTEDGGVGSGFLAEVSRDWEAAVLPAQEAGVRVVLLRIGLVVGRRGGLLQRLMPFAHAGLTPVLGSGKQWWSWIGLDDLLGAILHVLATPDIRGPVNAVAPQPVPMRAFAAALAACVQRSMGLRVPAMVLRAAVGEMADVALCSTRAVPDALRRSGFQSTTPSIDQALAWEIHGASAPPPAPLA